MIGIRGTTPFTFCTNSIFIASLLPHIVVVKSSNVNTTTQNTSFILFSYVFGCF